MTASVWSQRVFSLRVGSHAEKVRGTRARPRADFASCSSNLVVAVVASSIASRSCRPGGPTNQGHRQKANVNHWSVERRPAAMPESG
jgi:hypothetical protein